jgi:hypothetical protein
MGTRKPKPFATIVAARPIEANGLSDPLPGFGRPLITKVQNQVVAAYLIVDGAGGFLASRPGHAPPMRAAELSAWKATPFSAKGEYRSSLGHLL